VQAGAAATLTGLVFVAVSINLNQVISVPGLPGRAGEAVLQFFEVFLVASAGLIPRLTEHIYGMYVVAIGLAIWICQASIQIGYLRKRAGHPWAWFWNRALFTQLGTVPFIAGGALLWQGSSTGMYFLLPGFLFSFFAGLMSSWVLLVEILR